MMTPNKGVRAMLPKKTNKEKKALYDFNVRFVLFKKEFSLAFKVNPKKEQ
jgi:hypothetical protein